MISKITPPVPEPYVSADKKEVLAELAVELRVAEKDIPATELNLEISERVARNKEIETANKT